MSGIVYPYQPSRASGATYAPNAGAVAIALKPGCRQYCVTNLAATVVYVRVNSAQGSATEQAVVATAADQAIAANATRVFSKDADDIAGSVFCVGVGSVHITSGNGI